MLWEGVNTMVDKKYRLIYLFIGIIPLIYVLLVYNSTPDIVPIHFDIKFVADSFGSKKWMFLDAGVAILASVLFIFSPKLSFYKCTKQTLRWNLFFLILLDIQFIFIIYKTITYPMNI